MIPKGYDSSMMHTLYYIFQGLMYDLVCLTFFPSLSPFGSNFTGAHAFRLCSCCLAVMPPKGGVRSLPSRTHSCSEVAKGQKKLLQIKKEHPEPEELMKEIQEL